MNAQFELPVLSIVIPVFKESEYLEPLLNKLLSDPYARKEIFVAIDIPTEKSLELIARMEGKVNFNVAYSKRGKAEALNSTVKQARGEIILFLDSDVELNTKGLFLEDIVEEIKDADFLDIRKDVIRNSALSRVIHYDFLWFNAINWLYSRFIGKFFGVNGSAFAIRKKIFEEIGGFNKVLSEDMDITMRCYMTNCRFKFTNRIEVLNEVPRTWRAWFKQRRRWSLGTAYWIKTYYKHLIRAVRRHPKVLIPPLIFATPYPILILLNFYFTSLYYSAMADIGVYLGYLGHAFLSTIFALIFLKVALGNIILIKSGVETLAGFGMFSTLYRFLAKKLNYFFSFTEFIFFYFIYSPIWFGLIVMSMMQVALTGREQPTSW